MESKIDSAIVVAIIGEYGIVKVKEITVWNNHKMLGRKTFYDVCLEHGDGDIVASFDNIKEARKWAKENKNGN